MVIWPTFSRSRVYHTSKRRLFHTHADSERLVRRYRLVYLDGRGLPIEQLPLNAASLLSQVFVEGHDGERRKSLPPLEFGYTAFEPTQRRHGVHRYPGNLGHTDRTLDRRRESRIEHRL